MRCSEPCLRLSTSWMALTRVATSRCVSGRLSSGGDGEGRGEGRDWWAGAPLNSHAVMGQVEVALLKGNFAMNGAVRCVQGSLQTIGYLPLHAVQPCAIVHSASWTPCVWHKPFPRP